MIVILDGNKEKGRSKAMRKLFVLFGVFFVVLSFAGCASLGRLATELQEIDASQEISAISSVANDIIDKPWDDIISVGIGYALALLRRKYKISKGAK